MSLFLLLISFALSVFIVLLLLVLVLPKAFFTRRKKVVKVRHA
jgi:hypothetical protein